MQTYNTIKDAFKHGTGDVFFKINGQFIAVSRHNAECFEAMIADGFELMDYDDVMALDKSQAPVEKTPARALPDTKEATKQGFINYPDQEVWGYYNEFPDAYAQYL